MILYGRNPVLEAVRGPREVMRVWATAAAAREEWLAALGPKLANDHDLEQLCGSSDHQGVCAEVEPYRYADPRSLLESSDDALVVALDEVQDPRNLGAVIRVAECAGAAGVVIGERRAAQITPVVCKASAGAVEHMRVARARNLADYLAEAKQQGRGGLRFRGAWAAPARARRVRRAHRAAPPRAHRFAQRLGGGIGCLVRNLAVPQVLG